MHTNSLRLRCTKIQQQNRKYCVLIILGRSNGLVAMSKRKDWDNRKKKIMLDILRIKFKADSDEAKLLKDTDGKSLAEAREVKGICGWFNP